MRVRHLNVSRRDRPMPTDGSNASGRLDLVARGGAGDELGRQIATVAFAFRGYDVTNQGRSHELLEHRAFGPVVRAVLDEASAICSEALGAKIDLAARVRSRSPSTLETYAQDAATIVAMELAQVQLLEEFFGIEIGRACLSFGYSIGEVSALIAAEVYRMDQLLPVVLGLADDTASLMVDTTMGILFTRGPALPIDEVERLSRRISSQGRGLIGLSALLSPNAALLIGQGDTVDQFGLAMTDELTVKASLRRKPNRFPPLHTPLVRKRSIPNRAAVALYNVSGGDQAPSPKLVSCVTGAASYTEWNSREILIDWTDHPQRLWDVIDRTLASETRLIVHVGPEPTLIPATFSRLSENVIEFMRSRRLEHVGRYVIPGLSRHTWLTRMLPAGAALIRAPFVTHLILEDWLVAQDVP
ncbi:hypothetical protein BSF38_01977 [Paludisphaera borealis]|uniref:Malonyl-CoA:ACP transacylase (MAT) domain-containing protein n=2 Tax=Paludisphaera borealis TaxID=1387353 RepID=A0A1U7CNK1_9BACT|nr:hypothetical protein BSF38_01977 [Paludisphaera borealis]